MIKRKQAAERSREYQTNVLYTVFSAEDVKEYPIEYIGKIRRILTALLAEMGS